MKRPKRTPNGKAGGQKPGYKADYRGATPEEVGRALLRYRPAKNKPA